MSIWHVRETASSLFPLSLVISFGRIRRAPENNINQREFTREMGLNLEHRVSGSELFALELMESELLTVLSLRGLDCFTHLDSEVGTLMYRLFRLKSLYTGHSGTQLFDITISRSEILMLRFSGHRFWNVELSRLKFLNPGSSRGNSFRKLSFQGSEFLEHFNLDW